MNQAELFCPVCTNSKGLTSVWAEKINSSYSVVQCRKCKLAYTIPRPTEEELAAFYSEEYLEAEHGTNHGYSDYTFLPEMNMKRMWGELQKYAPLDQIRPRKVLDVGCATGAFLSQAKLDGWECLGVDPIAEAVHRANSEYGLDAQVGDIFSIDLNSEFGLLTLWHVIEHVIDPVAVLEKAHKLLASNGMIFMETPNWQSLGRIVKGTHWSQLKPPEHINFFDVDSLTFAVRKVGFEIVRCDTLYQVVVDRNFITSPKRIIMAVGGKIASAVNCGGYLRILARKK